MAFRLLNPNPVRGFHGGTPDARRLGRPRDDGRFFFSPHPMLLLLVLALADPLPGPREEPPTPEGLPYDEPAVPLRDLHPAGSIGVAVATGAFAWDDRWIAALTVALDFIADLKKVQLVVSPLATLDVHLRPMLFLGFEGQVVIPLAESLAVGVGTEQVVELSSWQTGALRFGPSLKPIIARSGPNRFSLQIVWLAWAMQERRYSGCDACSERPPPYYALGYGYFF